MKTYGATGVPGSIIGTDVSLTADIPAETMRHTFKSFARYGQPIGGTPANYEEMTYVASGPGVVKGFHGLCNASGSAASITMNLLKNGVSILSAPITITNATGNRQVVDATITNATLAAGDVLSQKLITSSTAGMQGPLSWACIQETSSPV